jgi:hypothetical protein
LNPIMVTTMHSGSARSVASALSVTTASTRRTARRFARAHQSAPTAGPPIRAIRGIARERGLGLRLP